MKRLSTILLAAGALLGASVPAGAQDGWWNPVVLGNAQQGDRPTIGDIVLGRNRDGRDAPTTSSRYPTDDRYGRYEDVRYESRGNGKRGNGPPFCRNGQGHPVHGRQWCADEGGGVGNGSSVWNRAGWGDVIFGGRTPTRDQRMGSPSIGDILGDVVLGRLTRHGREAGYSGPLDGRWLRLPNGGAVMQLRMGGAPLAELADMNLDGRADVILLSGR